MKIFLDTSSLLKLYRNENDSAILDSFFTHHTISSIFLSELAKLEFTSAVWKKVRTAEFDKNTAIELLELFETDFAKYTFRKGCHCN